MNETLVKISREADDLLCLRISIGGRIGEGLYCVYRLGPEGGNREDVIEMVKIILAALENAPPAT
jgi:hypothetical protein